jgi:hypothetical protein
MTKEFKYIENKDQYLDFLVGFENISTNDILADHKLGKLYRREIKEGDGAPCEEGILKMAESFLFLHQDREDYELCQVIIDHYPELLHEENISNRQAFDNMFKGTTPKDINF